MPMESPFGYTKNGKIYRKAFLDFPEREVGEVRENEADSFQYFVDRFDTAKKKVEELAERIDQEENKGSFLMKLIHLKKALAEYDAIGDFEPLFTRLDKYQNLLEDLIERNRAKNLELKSALLEEARALQESVDWKPTTEKLLEIKERWIRTGAVPENEKQGLEDAFHETMNTFFQRKNNFYEDRRAMFESREQDYRDLIEKLKSALASEGFEYVPFKEVKQQWRELENIPKERYEKLRNEFDQLLKQLRDRPKNDKKQGGRGSSADHQNVVDKKKEILNYLKDNEQEIVDKGQSELKSILSKWKAGGHLPKGNRNLNDQFYRLHDELMEKSFVLKLARAKNKKFNERPASERLRVKLNILKELIERDKRELDTALENAEKFNASSEGFNQLINSKLERNRRKIEIKQSVLDEFKRQLNSSS